MRALRLALQVSDVLLSMGVSARDVVVAGTTITDTYCLRRAEVDVNSITITISQDRGINEEPLTLISRHTVRNVNNLMVQQAEELVRAVSNGLHLDQAEARMHALLERPPGYRPWIIRAATAAIGPAVVLSYTTNPVILLTTLLVCIAVDRLAALLTRYQIPPFFCQIAASALVIVGASALDSWGSQVLPQLAGNGARLIAVGGIVMLVAGLASVAAAQDAIDEFYLTAAARCFKVVMLTSGIVVGIVLALMIVSKLGTSVVRVPENPIPLNNTVLQVVAVLLIACLFAISTQSSKATIAWACVISGLAWVVTVRMGEDAASVIIGRGFAAVLVGFLAALVARRFRSPGIAIATAAIVPFVPGMRLYQGLMQLVNHPPGTPYFETGLATLFTALSIALAIATGVSLGTIIGRPVHRRLAHAKRLVSLVMAESLRPTSFTARQLPYVRRSGAWKPPPSSDSQHHAWQQALGWKSRSGQP